MPSHRRVNGSCHYHIIILSPAVISICILYIISYFPSFCFCYGCKIISKSIISMLKYIRKFWLACKMKFYGFTTSPYISHNRSAFNSRHSVFHSFPHSLFFCASTHLSPLPFYLLISKCKQFLTSIPVLSTKTLFFPQYHLLFVSPVCSFLIIDGDVIYKQLAQCIPLHTALTKQHLPLVEWKRELLFSSVSRIFPVTCHLQCLLSLWRCLLPFFFWTLMTLAQSLCTRLDRWLEIKS